MPRLVIAHLEITAAVGDKLWSHGLVANQVRSVLFGRTVVTRNRASRAAPFVLLDRDEQRRCLAIPIVPTDDPVVWRVITGWYCKPSEIAKLRQRRTLMKIQRGIRYESIQEPLDDEERELMNPENWDWDNPIEVEVADNVGIQMPIDVTFEEFGLLEHVACAQGRSPHAFMKQVALDAARAKSPDFIYPNVNHQTRERRSG